jgi:hypothetical protein
MLVMKLSALINNAESALEKFGDLECFVDSDEDEDDCCAELQSFVCEVKDDGSKHILLTQYDVEFSYLRVVK